MRIVIVLWIIKKETLITPKYKMIYGCVNL